MGNSVNVEMPLLLPFFLVLPFCLSNPVSSEHSGLKEKDDLEETMYKNENLDDIETKVEELQRKLETKNVNVENLQKQLMEMEVQFESKVGEEVASLKSEMTELQNQLKEVKAEKKNQNQEIAKNLKSEVENQCHTEVKKELDKVLPTAVEQGLRDLPFEMVCAYQDYWTVRAADSIVNYDRITLEHPGGADGSMNIETGVFTTVTSGYYLITYTASVRVHAGDYTDMYLYHNGGKVEESRFATWSMVGSGDDMIADQGSRTLILHLLAGDTLDLRTKQNDDYVAHLTLCLYMLPAPYGL